MAPGDEELVLHRGHVLRDLLPVESDETDEISFEGYRDEGAASEIGDEAAGDRVERWGVSAEVEEDGGSIGGEARFPDGGELIIESLQPAFVQAARRRG